MGELDDLEEIDLTAHHDNDERPSARRIRAGRKRLFRTPGRSAGLPKWQRQLEAERGWDQPNHKKRTDTDPQAGT